MKNEKVLAVSRKALFGERNERMFEGFLPANQFHRNIFGIVRDNGKYLWRHNSLETFLDGIEKDENWKQIIPYVIFQYKRNFFLYGRKTGDSRLINKFSIGIGGHISEGIDNIGGLEIINGLKREFFEEVVYDGEFHPELLGFLNDENSLVDKVHFGTVFLVKGTTFDIKIHPSEEKDNERIGLYPYHGLLTVYPRMEKWSQILMEKVLPKL
jgi:predicted NUDIX family phosphoesterase